MAMDLSNMTGSDFSSVVERELSLNSFPSLKAYWSNKTDGKKDGPFCSNCWNTKKLTVRLHVNGPYHLCPIAR
jgi:hypothetical protein